MSEKETQSDPALSAKTNSKEKIEKPKTPKKNSKEKVEKPESDKPYSKQKSSSKKQELLPASKECVKTDEEKTLALDETADQSSSNTDSKFERLCVTLRFQKEKKFGLGIKVVHARVLVCKVDKDSMVDGSLKIGDQLETVDGENVLDNTQCKKMLLRSFTKKGHALLVILRPKTADSLSAIMEEAGQLRSPVKK